MAVSRRTLRQNAASACPRPVGDVADAIRLQLQHIQIIDEIIPCPRLSTSQIREGHEDVELLAAIGAR
jgi:hypothetical protein